MTVRELADRITYLAGKVRRRLLRRWTLRRHLDARDPLGDLEWNELPAGQGGEFNEVLVSLIGIAPDSTMEGLGTGFVASGEGRAAFGVTAAHVIWDAAHQAQNPNPRSHASMPDIFRSAHERVEVGPGRLRAAFAHGDRAALPSVSWVVWDKAAEVAFFGLESGDDVQEPAAFRAHIPFTNRLPRVGDRIGIIGYADTKVEQDKGRGMRSFRLARRLAFRVGRIKAVHMQGHALFRGPCVETSIPVFPGMSGSPVVFIPEPGGELQAFGVLSCDPKEPTELKQNRWHEGSSIVALLPIDEFERDGPVVKATMRVANVGVGEQPSKLPCCPPPISS